MPNGGEEISGEQVIIQHVTRHHAGIYIYNWFSSSSLCVHQVCVPLEKLWYGPGTVLSYHNYELKHLPTKNFLLN